MSWFALSIATLVLSAFSTLVQRVMMKKQESHPVVFMVLFQFFITTLLIGYFLVTRDSIPNLLGLIPNFVINVLLVTLGSLYMFEAIKLTEASDFTIIYSTSSIWALLPAVLFLNEVVDLPMLLGTGLIVLGVVLVSMRKKGSFTFHKGYLYSLVSAFGFGVAFVNEAFIVRQIGLMPDLLINFFTPGLLILLLKFKLFTKDNLKKALSRDSSIQLAVFSLLYLASALTIFRAYEIGGNATQIYPISNAAPILTVVLATLFLGETKNIPKKVLAVLLTFLGVMFLR